MSKLKCHPGGCRYSTITDRCIYCDHTRGDKACTGPDGHTWTIALEGSVTCNICGADFFTDEPLTKCQCGASAAGFDTHSHWCPKSEVKC